MSQRPTPQSIAICALIALRSDPSSPFHEIELSSDEQDNLTTFLESSVFARNGTAPALLLPNWMFQLRRQAGVEVAELLLDTISLASESVDSLLDLMDSLRAAIAEGLVDVVSAHGVFLRQICVGFEELSFESVTFLWQDLIEQLGRSKVAMERNVKDDVVPVESTALPFQQPPWPLSTAQEDDLLRQACFEIERGRNPNSKSFEAVELQVLSMIEKDPEMPSASFLRFLNCLHHGERVGAFEALHQFFDHATVQNSTPKEILQFSAILLAMTHSSFGDRALALMATEEVVRVAQQAKDAACVAFALGWLFENGGHGTADRRELLKRCATRATQGQIRPLVTGSRLRLALNMLEGEQSEPANIWLNLMEATSEPTAGNLPNFDRPTFMTQVPKQTITSLARQAWISAGVWDAFGMPALSGLASLAALKCYNKELEEEACISAIRNTSRLILYGTPSQLLLEPQQKSKPTKDQSIHVKAVTNLMESRRAHGLDGKAFDEPFLLSTMLMLFELSVNCGNTAGVQALDIVVHSVLRPGMPGSENFLLDIGIQKCRHLCRTQNWDKARQVAMDHLEPCKESGNKMYTVKLLLQLADLELETNPNQYVSALPHLLEAISICETSKIHGLHAVALSILARVFLRLRNPKRALAILKAALPTLLQREHIWNHGDAYLTNAKCHIQLAAACKSTAKRNRVYLKALDGLGRCERLFRQCQDIFKLKEVYYLQARIFAQLGNIKARDDASQRFLDLTKSGTNGKVPGPLESLTTPALLNRLVRDYKVFSAGSSSLNYQQMV